ncbi:MAG: serine/threonine-protein kinase, partial [Gemmatimonadota bacterium]
MEEPADRLRSALPDRYELVRELGRGGMATVYLAVDGRHDRRVALKVLSSDLVSGVAARRFVREIELVAKLTHPHVLPLLDSGLVDEQPFYVMPYVEGRSLRERLDEEGTLPVPEALRIARGVGEALACAHDSGIVHRDIKPGNILLTGGIAVVSDFGIATALERDTGEKLTRPGHSLGTPGYVSPEQAAGDGDVDRRSDQYALACVLFEMLAGDPPFVGRNLRAILGRQMTQPVPRISALRDGVPEGLDAVLSTALAR